MTDTQTSSRAGAGESARGRTAAPGPPERTPRAITFRAVLLGFLLVPANTFWIVYTELIRYAAHPTTTSLFFNVVFCISVLVALNALLKRYAPRFAFHQGELLVIYTILSLGYGDGRARHDAGAGEHHQLRPPLCHAGQPLGGAVLRRAPRPPDGDRPGSAEGMWNGGTSLLPPPLPLRSGRGRSSSGPASSRSSSG